MAYTTTLATVVNAVITMVDTIFNSLIAVSVNEVFFFTSCFVLGSNWQVLPRDERTLYIVSIAIIALVVTIYLHKLQVSDTWIQNLCLMTSYSLVWWLAIVFIIYYRGKSDHKDIKRTEVARYLFFITVRFPMQTFAAVLGAAIGGGAEAAMVTSIIVFLLQVWTIYERPRDENYESENSIIVTKITMIVAMNCISVHFFLTVIVGTLLKIFALVTCVSLGAIAVFITLESSRMDRYAKPTEYFVSFALGAMTPIAVMIVIDAGSKLLLVCVVIALALVYFVFKQYLAGKEFVALQSAIMVVSSCVIVYGIVCAGFLKELILPVLTVGLMVGIAYKLRPEDAWVKKEVFYYLPTVFVGELFLLQAKEVTSQLNTISAIVAVCLISMETRKLVYPHRITIVNFVIIVIEIGVLFSAILSWIEGGDATHPVAQCDTFTFDFDGLTIGQVASASSAAVGAGAVPIWIQNVVEFARVTIDEAMSGLQCQVTPALIGQVFRQQRVKDEFLTLLGCNKSETSRTTAERWRGYLHGMAVQMNLSNSTTGESHMSHMAIDAVRLDNALCSIISHTLSGLSRTTTST